MSTKRKPLVEYTTEQYADEVGKPVWFGRKGPKPFEPNVLQRFRIDPAARVQALDSIVDLTHNSHIVLDMPDTRRHDDSVFVQELDKNLYQVYVSTPLVHDARMRFDRLPYSFEAKVRGNNKGLSAGVHRAFTTQILTDGQTMFDAFSYPSIVRCETYVHRPVTIPLPQSAVWLPRMRFPVIPKDLGDALRAPFGVRTTEQAIERLMLLQWAATGATLAAYGVPAPFASLDYARGGKSRYTLYTAEPRGGGENVVSASSPLRVREHLVGAYQMQALCDPSIPLIGQRNMHELAVHLSDVNRRAA